MTSQERQPLRAFIRGGVLTISIGVETLAHAVRTGQGFGGDAEVLVSDVEAFARDVLRELEREQEDGTTPVHAMLDAAARAAVEDGTEHAQVSG